MQQQIVLLLLLLCLGCWANIRPFATIDQLEKFAIKSETMLVLLYESPCNMCKQLEGAGFAAMEQQTEGRVKVGKIDLKANPQFRTKHQALMTKNNMHVNPETPGFMVFKYGIALPYNGPKDFQQMQYFLQRPSSVIYFKNKDTKDEFLEQNSLAISIIAYVKSDSSPEYNELKRLAHVLSEEAQIAATSDAKIAKNLGLKNIGNFIMYKPFDNRPVFTDKPTLANMHKFFVTNKESPLSAVNPANVYQIMAFYDTVIVGFIDNAASALTKNFLTNMKNVAASRKQDATFKAIYTSLASMDEFLQRIGVHGANAPFLVALAPKKGKNYVFDKSMHDINSRASVESWLDDISKGTAQSLIKSEKVDETANSKAAIKKLTYNNFATYTQGADKTTLVAFTTPTCPHCVALQPIFELVAKHFSEQTSVTLGKMDTASNTTPEGIDVKFVPTLILFKQCGDATTPQQVPFNGNRSFDDLVAFINKEKCQ